MIQLEPLIDKYHKSDLHYKLPVILGVDEYGEPAFEDLTNLQHILITGSTGSGKSMFMHTMISTLLSSFSTHEFRLMLVDMKRVELTIYDGLPYLLSPVTIRADKVYACLNWLIDEKERRLKIIGELEKQPSIVVFIDTFSDLMQEDSVKFQDLLSKFMDRASEVKIHVVMSDSRPSSDIYTPLILKLFPTKICFNVSEASYSKFIIGNSGGEKLKGAGDMLLLYPDNNEPKRIQAPFISDENINQIVSSKTR